MPEHLSRTDLDEFASGTLSREERARMLRHLLRGCVKCSRILAAATGLGPASKVSEGGYDSALERAWERVFGRAPKSSNALAMLSLLLSGQRTWKELSATEIGTLQGVPQVRALLHAGRSLRHHDPEATLRFARLARYAADHLSPTECESEAVADLRSLSWAELANAHRVCDDLPRAGQAMNRAIHWSRRGSRSPLLIARIADLVASLLGAQRRFGEGQKLLALAHEVYEREGQPHLAGRVLIKAGNLAAWNGAPGKAIQLMRKGLDLLEPRREPELVAQTLRNMIWFLSDLGQFRSARRLLWRCRHLFVEHGNALDLLRLRWLEARIYEGLSDPKRAECAFEETRSGFTEKGQVYPAALAALDLAALWTRQGRIKEVCALAEEIIETFPALRVAREAIAALVMVKHVCSAEGGTRILDVIQLVVRFLEELERQPTWRHSSGPESSPPARWPVA